MIGLSRFASPKLQNRFSPTPYAGFTFQAPWGLSSGWADTLAKMIAMQKLGAGVVISKTITFNSRKGNPRPRIIRLADGLINSMGLPNRGLMAWYNELTNAKNIPDNLIFSVKGETLREWRLLINKISRFTDIIELNFSCPNVSTGIMDLDKTIKILSKMRAQSPNIKLFLKLSPQYTNHELMKLILRLFRSNLIDGLSLFNTIPVKHNNLGNPAKIGGYSGPKLFERLIELLSLIREESDLRDIPIFAMGGIISFEQAMTIWKKYNSVPLVLTSFLMEGPFIFKKWANKHELRISSQS